MLESTFVGLRLEISRESFCFVLTTVKNEFSSTMGRKKTVVSQFCEDPEVNRITVWESSRDIQRSVPWFRENESVQFDNTCTGLRTANQKPYQVN